MTERGILMTPENYAAILDNRKTQTRRIVDRVDQSIKRIFYLTNAQTVPNGPRYTGWAKECGAPFIIPLKCPYGMVGDRLYVKEGLEKVHGQWMQYRRDKTLLHRSALRDTPRIWEWKNDYLSPMHMPKWAARLWLEILEVRVERLQEITEADAKAEGCEDKLACARSIFAELWNSIHGDGAWDLNHWVFVLSFKKVPV